MDNKTIVSSLKLLGQLLELFDENPFKVKSLNNAAYKLGKYSENLSEKSMEELSAIDGVGKSVAQKIDELRSTGSIEELEKLKENTPEGIIAMLRIKGLGPKKVQIIWQQLGITNLGELYYACNENRLIEAKGFGLKTQEEIKKLLEFTMSNEGFLLLHHALSYAELLTTNFNLAFPNDKLIAVGQIKRHCEVIEVLEFLISDMELLAFSDWIKAQGFKVSESTATSITCKNEQGNNFIFHVCKSEQNWTSLECKLNCTAAFLEALPALKAALEKNEAAESEQAVFAKAGLSWIPEVLREDDTFVIRAKENNLPKLIVDGDLKGSLHNHSTWSDGVHSLKEMADYCAEIGYQYLGICDHSKSAFYANGLSIERVLQQHAEIEQYNAKHATFKILKGIESDILGDGALDYPDEILAQFDFVVASIHSNLKMTEEKANERLLKAIENKYTQILGHPTGRLLLARQGYPINHKLIIDACAANRVAIEINANPVRLDLDWRWIDYAISKGVMLAINPDAHRKEGYHDMRYGVMVAQKGGLDAAHCLNAMPLHEIEKYFQTKFS